MRGIAAGAALLLAVASGAAPVAAADGVPPPASVRAEPGAGPPAQAEQPARRYLSGAEEPALPAYEPGSGLVSLLSGLLLVLALIAGLAYLVRRLSGRRFPASRRDNAIHVLASRGVGPRQGLLLVEVGGQLWLLAQGADGIRLVAEVSDPDARRRLAERYGFLEAPFEAELRRHLDEQGEGRGPAAAAEPSPEERLAALRRRPPSAGEP